MHPLNGRTTIPIDTDTYPIDSTWTVTVSDPELCSAELETIHSELQKEDSLLLAVNFKKTGEVTVYLTNGTLTYSTEVAFFQTEDGGYGTETHALSAVNG